MAPSVVWDSSFSVGVEKFDDQHKNLFAIIDELDVAIHEGKEKFFLGTILERLQEYTSKHFLAEELEMMINDYPNYESHKSEHDKLKAQVRQFYSDFYAGEAIANDALINFLNDWLINHIARTDKSYSPFFAEKGIQ